MDGLTLNRLALSYMRRQMWLGRVRLAPLAGKSDSPGGPARPPSGAKGKVSPGEFLRTVRSR